MCLCTAMLAPAAVEVAENMATDLSDLIIAKEQV